MTQRLFPYGRPRGPLPVSLEDDPEDRLTAAGRTNWFSLLFYLTFAMITVLGVEDADIFIDSRQTQLPLIGVSIPTASFFIFAPVLGAALYIYLHLLIRKSTDAIAHAPPRIRRSRNEPDGIPIERAIQPWLVNDLLLRMRNQGAIDPRPMDRLADFVTIAMAWCAGPYVLGVIWQNTFTLHHFWLTSFAGLCFFASVVVGVESWAKAERDTRFSAPAVNTTTGQRKRRVPALLLLVLLTGYLGTKGIVLPGNLQQSLPGMLQGRLFAASPDLREAPFSLLPPDQQNPAIARARYRADWCKRIGHGKDICGPFLGRFDAAAPHLLADRRAWCLEKDGLQAKESCDAYFKEKDDQFSIEWSAYRAAFIDALEKPDMRGRDLRNADLTSASLAGVEFTGANLAGADLGRAQMERAVLSGARMEGAVLWEAQMEGAVHEKTQMAGADLNWVQMEGANLSKAQMQGADLGDAQMQRASLNGTNLDGARLEGARLDEADLSGAQMQLADLSRSQMEGANLSRAQMQAAILLGAQMEEVILRQAQMDGADLGWARLTGAPENVTVLAGTNLSASINHGGALRFADLRQIAFSAATDWRNAFLDGSVALPDGFPAPVVRACGWITGPIAEDAEFFGKWRGWLEVGGDDHFWRSIAPEKWRDVEAILPHPELREACQWDRSPLPGAEVR